MSPTTKRKLMLVLALFAMAAAFGLLASGVLTANLVPYHDPSAILAAGPEAIGPTVRLGGQVEQGSVDFDQESRVLSFRVTDGERALPVQTSGVPPELFREGIGAVIEGTMGEDGVFHGSRILVKHSNEYRAPVEGKHPSDIYKTVEGL